MTFTSSKSKSKTKLEKNYERACSEGYCPTIKEIANDETKKLPDFLKHKIIELLLVLRENPVPAEHYDIRNSEDTRILLETELAT